MRHLFLFTLIFTVSLSASAQVYVRIRPIIPVTVSTRPAQPTRNHVWIDEEWQPRGRHYKYTGGHWQIPPRNGYIRKEGHWQKTKRGNRWILGSWRKG